MRRTRSWMALTAPWSRFAALILRHPRRWSETSFWPAAFAAGTASPPAFFHFYHCGYEETWDKAEWNDPDMPRPFSEYVQDSVRRGWWGGIAKPGPSVEPQVLIVVGTNPIRRQRGGTTTLLENLWPKLEKIVVVDNRMSATALQAGHRAAGGRCSTSVRTFSTRSPTRSMLVFRKAAVPPAGEAKTEWNIFRDLAKKVEEKAEEMGVDEYPRRPASGAHTRRFC